MSTEVLVGLIGLGGALIGAAAAFAGVVYQQRYQAKHEEARRLIQLSEGAIDSLVEQLEDLRQHAWRYPEEGPELQAWTARLGDLMPPMRLTMMRLSDATLRKMLEAAWLFEFGHNEAFQQEVGLRSPKLLITATAGEAQACLGHLLRRESLPPSPFLSSAVRTRALILQRPR